MRPRVRSWALTLWAALVVGVLILNLIDPPPGLEDAWQWVGGQLAFPVGAALILIRRPGNRVGLALAVVANATLINFFLYWFALAYPDSALSPAAEAVSGAMVPIMFGGIIAVLYIFPTGRTPGGWHARVFAGFVVLITIIALGLLLTPHLVETGRDNPFGVLPEWSESMAGPSFAALPLFGVAGLVSMVFRWRRADTLERTQLRWLMSAAVLFAVILLLIAVTDDAEDEPGTLGFLLASSAVVLAFWSIPAAIVVAVIRYRLFDIDRLISRTVTYALVAGVIGVLFAGIAIGLPRLLGLADESPPILVAAATLAAAALFNPFRRRIQGWVDRRFNRARYDAQREVEGLAERLQGDIELDDLTHDVLNVVSETVQPTAASMWIRGSDR